MKSIFRIPFLLISLGFVFIGGFAQDTNGFDTKIKITIPEHALLDLESENSPSIVVFPASPEKAGTAIDFSKSPKATVWLNYSSIIGSKANSGREITAAVEGGMPDGMVLKLDVSEDVGQGAGQKGVFFWGHFFVFTGPNHCKKYWQLLYR